MFFEPFHSRETFRYKDLIKYFFGNMHISRCRNSLLSSAEQNLLQCHNFVGHFISLLNIQCMACLSVGLKVSFLYIQHI